MFRARHFILFLVSDVLFLFHMPEPVYGIVMHICQLLHKNPEET
jgi:hypothetical protein